MDEIKLPWPIYMSKGDTLNITVRRNYRQPCGENEGVYSNAILEYTVRDKNGVLVSVWKELDEKVKDL